MTTVLSLIVGDSVIHASDRLLTTTDGREWDPQSNKTVVHWGKNHFFVAGYTGLAFTVDGKPTDQWIAEILTTQDLDDVGALQVATKPVERMDAYHAIDALREAAELAFPSGVNQRPTFVVHGIQTRRRRYRPISILIRPTDVGYSRIWDDIPHYETVGHGVFRHIGIFFDDVKADLLQRLDDGGALEDLRGHLVQAIRQTADRTGSVGRNIMTVIGPSSQTDSPVPLITVRYERDPRRFEQPQIVEDRFGIGRVVHVTAYTPWIIHPFGFVAPALDSNTNGWNLGHLRIAVESSHPIETTGFFFGSQRRRKLRP